MKSKIILILLILILTPSIIAEKVSISNVKEGQVKIFEYREEVIIQSIAANFTSSGGLASITITKLGLKPQLSLSRKKTYNYIQIEPSPNDIPAKDLFIRFKVTDEWIGKNALLSNEVALKRLVDNKWENLQTRVLSKGEKYHYFEASIKSLESEYYSIGEKEIEKIRQEEQPKEDVIPEQIIEEINQTEKQEEILPQKPKIALPLIGWSGAILAIALLLIILAHQRKRIRRMMKQRTKYLEKEKLETLRIVGYIQNAEAKGKTRKEITEDLKKAGWEKKKIKKAFNELKF